MRLQSMDFNPIRSFSLRWLYNTKTSKQLFIQLLLIQFTFILLLKMVHTSIIFNTILCSNSHTVTQTNEVMTIPSTLWRCTLLKVMNRMEENTKKWGSEVDIERLRRLHKETCDCVLKVCIGGWIARETLQDSFSRLHLQYSMDRPRFDYGFPYILHGIIVLGFHTELTIYFQEFFCHSKWKYSPLEKSMSDGQFRISSIIDYNNWYLVHTAKEIQNPWEAKSL